MFLITEDFLNDIETICNDNPGIHVGVLFHSTRRAYEYYSGIRHMAIRMRGVKYLVGKDTNRRIYGRISFRNNSTVYFLSENQQFKKSELVVNCIFTEDRYIRANGIPVEDYGTMHALYDDVKIEDFLGGY